MLLFLIRLCSVSQHWISIEILRKSDERGSYLTFSKSEQDKAIDNDPMNISNDL